MGRDGFQELSQARDRASLRVRAEFAGNPRAREQPGPNFRGEVNWGPKATTQ
jgi:hypothetical protein